ncbi:NAD(P)-binding protein [Apiospora phragmitis]|uniref:NAD(P)-binding protein n=1 Tax=Apiospora phragmitis TaxID=2905665 RepID=A0ABR1UKI0_9PEZI
MTDSSRVWLITGCSSGLGARLAHRVLARGDRVIATARRVETLAELEQAGAAVLSLDVTADQQAVRQTVDAAIQIYGRVDVLVNNAAYLAIGTWEDLEIEDFSAQFETNVFGTIKVTRAMLPHLRARRDGTLVFIGSRSGWIGDAGVGAYAGSKFALEGLVEALKGEVEPLGIKTLLIEPGRFRTKLLTLGNMKAADAASDDYAPIAMALMAHLAAEDQQQHGDPDKLVDLMIDLVRHEGVAAGREVPFRFPVGTDVHADVKAKCRQTLELLDDWEAVLTSTDFGA